MKVFWRGDGIFHRHRRGGDGVHDLGGPAGHQLPAGSALAAAARNVSKTMFQYHLVSLLGAVLAGIAG